MNWWFSKSIQTNLTTLYSSSNCSFGQHVLWQWLTCESIYHKGAWQHHIRLQWLNFVVLQYLSSLSFLNALPTPFLYHNDNIYQEVQNSLEGKCLFGFLHLNMDSYKRVWLLEFNTTFRTTILQIYLLSRSTRFISSWHVYFPLKSVGRRIFR